MIRTATRRGSTPDDRHSTLSDAGSVVDLIDVSVNYGANRVLKHLSLHVQRGEILALLGPSGSGKTTVIRTIGGFITPVEGTVLLGGRDVTDAPPHKRGVGVMFQTYALFPHMSVFNNLAYPLKAKGVGRATITKRCNELLEMVRLAEHGDMRPARLSGGQQQRVALARALAMDPEVLLLDEPLSNLDANLRRDVGAEIRRLQQSTGTTAIMVTHDRQEAFGMADRIAVLRAGLIEQLGSPRELYRQPTSRFMAEFVGDANFIRGTVVGRPDSCSEILTVQTPLGMLDGVGRAGIGDAVDLLMRPEDLRIDEHDRVVGRTSFTATLREAFYYGNSVVATVETCDHALNIFASGSSVTLPVTGEPVQISMATTDCIVIPAGERE